MSQHQAWTKDEKFLIALYRAAMEKGVVDHPFDRYEVAQKINLHPKGADTICVLLLQANFIKKGEGKEVYLAQNGEDLVKSLIE
ncbi:MAG: hypothetical protein H0W50_07690 [Parachlamydiaceae bacterium]|nr:hypothetical protein [Parachlamydiaceae bacterium]